MLKDYIIAFGPYLLMAVLGVTGYLARQLYTGVKAWQEEAEARMNQIEHETQKGRKEMATKVDREVAKIEGKLETLPERYVPRPELDEWRRGLDDRIDGIARGQDKMIESIKALTAAWTDYWKGKAQEAQQ